MSKKIMNHKQKVYIKKIELSDFRMISKLSFEPGKNLNIISGKNGTAKSTILGMIAQGFSFNPKVILNLNQDDYKNALNTKDEKVINDYESLLTCNRKKFESQVNEHFKLSEEDAKGKKHADFLIEGSDSFIIESNDYSDRKNPRLVTRRKNAKSSNVILPVLYFGLNRLVPLVLSGTLKAEDLLIDAKELTEIHDLYETILLKQYNNNPVGITNSQKKNTLSFMDKERSLEMISSGEDNVGQILLALYSFKKLRDNYPEYKGGILLIDEIDATLYPAAQLKLIEIIYEKAVNFGIQVFVTTHSLDIIEHSMKLKLNNEYSKYAVQMFNLQNKNNNLKIEHVKNIQNIKNEFYASISKNTTTERINIYFEDKEAIFLFKHLISSSAQKKLKIAVNFTLGCNELIKLRKLNIPEFVNQSLVCLDGDNPVPSNYKNYFNLPIINKLPPEQFVYKIICDSNSNFWKQTKNYDHTIFMNNPHYKAIRQILNGSYGIEPDNDDGLYNNYGDIYYRKKPREVWKMWFKHEQQYFINVNNPVKYWQKQNINNKNYKKFKNDFEKALDFVAKEKGIVL